MTTVYIDVLFLVNMIMDLMIHTATCLIRRRKIIIWRILCVSAAESVCALGLFLASEWVFIYYIFAIILFVICIWFSMEHISFRDFIINICAAIFCAVVFAGIFFLIYQFTDVGSVVVFNNNVLYIDIPVFGLLCVSGLCLGIMVLVSKAFVRVVPSSSEYSVCVHLFQQEKCAKAKIDTGNDMTDPISGSPVLLADRNWLTHILPDNIDDFIACQDVSGIESKYQSRLRMIHCRTAMGTGILPAIRPDFIRFTYNSKQVTVRNVLIAISKTKLNEYDLLLTPHIFKEIEYDTPLDK